MALVSRTGALVGGPAWSPDGTRIAFAIDSAIYVVNADGTGLRKLVDEQSVNASSPVWTPDGSRIVFWGDDHRGGGTLLTMAPDGSDVRPFSPSVPEADVLVPSWSPDGAWLALGGLPNAVSPLYLMRLDGGPVDTFGPNASEPTWRLEPSS